MKRIKYKFSGLNKSIPYNERNLIVAEKEADGGEYIVEEVEDVATPLTVAERLTNLEKAISVNEYEPGKRYYRGDRVKFNEKIYTCIAPVGVVCVWNPEEYAQYWEVTK